MCNFAAVSGERIQIKEVVAIARMVPIGMDFWASLRSPERFEPAMIPKGQHITENHIHQTEQVHTGCSLSVVSTLLFIISSTNAYSGTNF